MIDTGVAFRYARALYDLAREQDRSDQVVEDMAVLRRLFSEIPELRRYCLRQRKRDSSASEREFAEIALLPYLGDLTGRTVAVAIRNGRIGILPFLPAAYRTVSDRSEGTVRVLLETAREPASEIVEQVRASMERRTGKRVRMETAVTPEILGGVRISWDSRLIDLSAAFRLKRMRAWIKTA